MGALKSAKILKTFEFIINLIVSLCNLSVPLMMGVLYFLASGLNYLWYFEYDDNGRRLLATSVGMLIGAVVILVLFILYLIFGIGYIKGCSRLQNGINPVVTYTTCKKRQTADIVFDACLIVISPIMSFIIASTGNIDVTSFTIFGFVLAFIEIIALVLGIISLTLFKKGKRQLYGDAF